MAAGRRGVAALVASVALTCVAAGANAAAAHATTIWLSGRVVARDGRAFDYTALFFRFVAARRVVMVPAQASVLDESSGRDFSQRRLERGDLGLADASDDGRSVRSGSWRLREVARGDGATLRVELPLRGAALALSAVARKRPYAFRSLDGATHAGFSAMTSDGSVDVDGRRIAVTGTAWFDRSDAPPDRREFASVAARVSLDDGRQAYVETSTPVRGRHARRSALLIERDGRVDRLREAAYEFGGHPGSNWHSPHTGTTYPDIWALHVDDVTPYLSLEPVAYDQESASSGDGRSYWNGAVDVYDVTPGSAGWRLGSGFVLQRPSAATAP